MHHDDALPYASPQSDTLWFGDGSPPYAREDRLAEAIALAALVFSLAIGLVIATLPVSDKAAAAAEAALEPSASHAVPARAAPAPRVDHG